MSSAFIDLDELILRCRDKRAKQLLQEAVACYRVGAFRSCIVSTWNAVVFDFLHKLRELELLGDKEAEDLLGKFDQLRSSGNKFRELWQFEADIPEIALTKFELISTVEKSDIERLFKDRSRCAHPSMTSLEEPFEATAELARYHLRSAVTHLLERPPVQGRSARERIFQIVKSEYFPIEPEKAVERLKRSPLARARFLLIKDIVIGLSKALLLEDLPEDERLRLFSALNAVSKIYPQHVREILNDQLSDLILNRVKDENWNRVILYLGSVDAWDQLSNPCILNAVTYIEKLETHETHRRFYKRISQEAILVLKKASRIDFLRHAVIQKLRIPIKELLELKDVCEDDFFKENILIPILKDLSPEATLDDLLSMTSESLLEANQAIRSHIEDKVYSSSVRKLVSIIRTYEDDWLLQLVSSELKSKIPEESLEKLLQAKSIYESAEKLESDLLTLFKDFIVKKFEDKKKELSLDEMASLMVEHEDDFLLSVMEPELLNRIPVSSLEDLLEAKSIYNSIENSNAKIVKAFSEKIETEVKTESFENLLDQGGYWDEIPDDMLKPILKTNISAILDKFKNSGSFYSAGSNARLLVKVAEYLSSEQWQVALDAFFENGQIYSSYSCHSEFENLFNRSLEISGSVKPYWRTFRERISEHRGKHVSSLRRLIDSHLN
jgi:hypothetical protein